MGVSEYLAVKVGLFERHFAMYKKMQKNEELEEDIEFCRIYPDMILL